MAAPLFDPASDPAFEERAFQPADSFLSQRTIEWLLAVALFAATALVVVWQNAHVAVLWDLSYTLEHAYRISLGDVPYRDFPFVHPPITFLIQAAIIKLTGRVFWHHVVYCAVAGAVGTVLAWRVMRHLSIAAVHGKLIAFLLAAPLVPLGIYSVFPHPFYDPDCSLALLISIALLLNIDRKPSSFVLPTLTGISLVVPLFVKQNTGLAFLGATFLLLGALTVWKITQRESVRHYLVVLIAAIVTLVLAILVISRVAGLSNYWHWTIRFAAERRTPARGEMLGIYADKMNLLWLGFIVLGIAIVWLNRQRNKLWSIVASLIASFPFVWPTIYLWRDSDASERADRLINVWPVLLVLSFIISIITIRRRKGVAKVLPFIILAAINGCFMSQQLWGSTYAIWPLLMILIAMMLVEVAALLKHDVTFVTVPMALLVALSFLVSGAFYVRSHERLSYANLDDGELKHSSLPQLRGLSTRGDWIPNFEELVRYSAENIPANAGILLLPGEDAFYYTTGRRPQFPVLLFDHTVNPYSPEQIREICRQRNITWVIVKQDLQNEEDTVDKEKDQITDALETDFEQVESLTNYDIYRRIDPNVRRDSDDANDDDDDKPSSP